MTDLFAAAGALREAYDGVDWSASPLGPVSSWSPALASTVRMALRTRFPVTLLWGPDYCLVYNEAYVPLIAHKHPAALGRPAREVFPEIWDIIGPMLDQAAKDTDATLARNLRLLMDRHGYLEETYFTFSYSAVTGPDGQVEGVIDIAAETTEQVIGNRRLQVLHRLSERLADVEHRHELIDRALPVLRAAADFSTVTVLDGPVTDDDDGRTAHFRLGDDSVLNARLNPHLPVDDAYQGFLRLVGGTLTQALDRILARDAERLVQSLERAMSETLQQSLLTQPVQPDHLQVAVRYQSSIAQSHIGGDWYDAFHVPGGMLTVAVGDVSGHDREAAAAMAQVRNLLRGTAYTVIGPPSSILAHLSRAMTGLPVDALATVVVAQIEGDPSGARTFRWSNAGQVPPVLLTPDGAARLLRPRPEPLLGMRAEVQRTDHTVTLEPGSAVVLYTDGLIERRHTTVDEGLDRLVAALTGRQHLDAERICDHLLSEFAGSVEDDVALTVIRVL